MSRAQIEEEIGDIRQFTAPTTHAFVMDMLLTLKEGLEEQLRTQRDEIRAEFAEEIRDLKAQVREVSAQHTALITTLANTDKRCVENEKAVAAHRRHLAGLEEKIGKLKNGN